MSLATYNKKRHFNDTPEPEGKSKSTRGALKFVIQKHDASHLHYDFRLEMEGVLKSWAVPKGPSLNPENKRLAMMVEDHPFDYRNFEGIIPEGNYGAGTVIVWDEGTYAPIGGEELSRKEQEKILLQQLKTGNIKIWMEGEKIRGEYALFLMKTKGDRSWILMKKNDKHATTKEVLKKDRSVKTNKSLAQVAKDNGTVPNHPEEKEKKKSPPIQLLDPEKPVKKSPAKRGSKKKSKSKIEVLPAVAQKAKFPAPEKPMLASLVEDAFDDPNWIYEIKWDGYRALAYVQKGKAEIFSRNLLSFSETYSPVQASLRNLDADVVLDGEIIALNEKGMADFQLLQNYKNAEAPLQYYVFDILHLNGYDLREVPLIERKKLLKELLPADDPVLKYSDHIAEKGIDFFEAALNQGLEGIMAKNAESIYQQGARTKDWLKIKVNLRQEVVIGGFTAPRNSRKHFGSLMLGVYEGDDLVYVGHTGSGFDTSQLDKMYRELSKRVIKKSPFKTEPKANMPATWVKPELVCEIKFTEWTGSRIARHPIFMGLRSDKDPKDVKFEKSTTIDMASSNKAATKKSSGTKIPAKKTAPKKIAAKKFAAKKEVKNKTLLKKTAGKKAAVKRAAKKSVTTKVEKKSQKSSGSVIQLDLAEANEQLIQLEGHELKITNLNKPYWKKEKFLKGDMINYYLKIAPYILPYLVDRPHSLNRHPNGISGSNFYQKDTKDKVPDWIQKHVDYSESNDKLVHYFVCNGEASLIYMANMGCIEINPWHSRTQSWQNPDWCLIDLDPDDGNSFEQVVETAQVVKEVLDAIGAESCVKTSGSTGIHIYIPLGAKYSYEQSRQLAELIVNVVHNQLPDFTSVLRNPSKRKGKIYLDFLQNREIQTAAAPYCLRPKPGVPVSTPLDWSEVKKGLTQTTWNAKNIFDRLKTEGDIFKPVLGKGIDLEKILKNLASYLGS